VLPSTLAKIIDTRKTCKGRKEGRKEERKEGRKEGRKEFVF
jgi:hypothetical protein